MRGDVMRVLLDIAVPVGLYYGCVAAGATERTGLLAAAGGALALTVAGVVRERRLEPLPLVMVLGALAAVVAGAVTGSPRLLLVRDAYVGIPLGLAFLVTACTPRPVLNRPYRALLARTPDHAARWDQRVAGDPAFRRRLAGMTALWGAVGVAVSAAQVMLAYALPVRTAVAAVNLTVPIAIVVAAVATAPLAERVRRAVAAEG